MNQVANPFSTRTDVVETSGARQAQSRELAEMQTKFLMAQQFPRDERKAFDAIMNSFSRPSLAEVACYEYAKGGSTITGLSVHAMQAIAQQWGNIEFGWSEVARGIGPDGVTFSEVRAIATDLQTRTIRPLQFIVRHWRDTKRGGYALTDEREVYELCANMAQRRVRACLMAVIPRDVQDAAEEQAATTLKTKADTSPEAVQKMIEAFAPFKVTKEHLEKFIQRRLDSISPAQVVRLKRIYASLRDDMSTPADWFDMGDAAEATATGLDAVKAATQAKGKAAATPAPAPWTDPDTGEQRVTPRPAPHKKPPAPAANDAAAATATYAQLADLVQKERTRDDALHVLDQARHLPADQQADLMKIVDRMFSESGDAS